VPLRLVASVAFFCSSITAAASEPFHATSDQVIGLSQAAYNAWDGDLENPHFLFPGDTAPAPPRAWEPSDPMPQDDAEAQLWIPVATIRCSIEAQNPHMGTGPRGVMDLVTKAKGVGRCQVTPLWGSAPLPPPCNLS